MNAETYPRPTFRQRLRGKLVCMAAVLLCTVAAVALNTGVHAQQNDLVVSPAAPSGAMDKVDATFALYAASSNLAQIEAARRVMGATRGTDVRDFAQRVSRDHSRAEARLRKLVVPRGVDLPAAPTGRHADLVTKLAGVPAANADEAYLMRFGVDAHKDAITLFERHAAEGRDPALTAYARDLLPMLREHLATAGKLLDASGRAR